MFTYFECIYLSLYLFSLLSFFTLSFVKLNYFEDTRVKMSYLELCDNLVNDSEFLDLQDNIIKEYDLNCDIEQILVCVENNTKSKLLLLLLDSIFPESKKIAIHLDNDETIKNLCEEYDYLYYNKTDEFKKEYNYATYDNKLQFILDYSNICNIKYCFMNFCNNDIMDVIIDGMCENNYSTDISKFNTFEYDNVNVYNIMSNMIHYFNLMAVYNKYFEDNNISFELPNYYKFRDLYNDNWRNNFILTYNQLRDQNYELDSKIISLLSIKDYDNGSVFNLTNKDTIPYWIWENMFNQIIDNHNISVEKEVIQTLYYSVNKTNTDEGEILQNWRYYFNENIFVLYNYKNLQSILEDCVESTSGNETFSNSLENFLNGKLKYKILSDTENLDINDIELNLEDISLEEIFSNFCFTNNEKGLVFETKYY